MNKNAYKITLLLSAIKMVSFLKPILNVSLSAVEGLFWYRKKFFIIFILITLTSCNEETLPKPKAFLRLAYEAPNYQKINTSCPYTFEISNKANAIPNEQCWVNVEYPTLKASLNITYRPVENNLNELLREAEKLTYNHAIKADGISAPQLYDNFEKKTYGALSEVRGNAASPLQFHLTDSTTHFITGALYFKVQPNYDSILPAIRYIEKDIKHLMETLEWER
ncbi:MAG: gliding motility lipoprotein GldD [Flavobacteriaceae bacterium]|nr:gliding motility lipoprotein GldD [Flavobacteriaceae bacterium]